jgi:hypothetical protein
MSLVPKDKIQRLIELHYLENAKVQDSKYKKEYIGFVSKHK